MMRYKPRFLLLAILASLMTACVPNISPDEVQAGNANQATETIAGRIVSMQATTVTADSSNKTGMWGGAALGGIAGSALGGGTRMNMLGAVGGALVGGIAGNAIQNKISTQQGTQYTIKTPTGSLLTVVQGPTPAYSMNQCVLMVQGDHARITGVADESVCSTIPLLPQNTITIKNISADH